MKSDFNAVDKNKNTALFHCTTDRSGRSATDFMSRLLTSPLLPPHAHPYSPPWRADYCVFFAYFELENSFWYCEECEFGACEDCATLCAVIGIERFRLLRPVPDDLTMRHAAMDQIAARDRRRS